MIQINLCMGMASSNSSSSNSIHIKINNNLTSHATNKIQWINSNNNYKTQNFIIKTKIFKMFQRIYKPCHYSNKIQIQLQLQPRNILFPNNSNSNHHSRLGQVYLHNNRFKCHLFSNLLNRNCQILIW